MEPRPLTERLKVAERTSSQTSYAARDSERQTLRSGVKRARTKGLLRIATPQAGDSYCGCPRPPPPPPRGPRPKVRDASYFVYCSALSRERAL